MKKDPWFTHPAQRLNLHCLALIRIEQLCGSSHGEGVSVERTDNPSITPTGADGFISFHGTSNGGDPRRFLPSRVTTKENEFGGSAVAEGNLFNLGSFCLTNRSHPE
ncbi:hypothetical protein NE237_030749 [Protea cynaroides]|uniref:Uncharacterized protein n=1 Tax=Protea cynaroides TaxID=273540 RepID=A0A9Q0GTL4_9MAGN|nr:hypothetical protein NE237_030749 [Protea cynaroides]